MGNTKDFRADWYPRDAFIDFSELDAEHIGVLMQIINLIYIKEGPIENDPKHIGKSCSITKGRCDRIINTLINKEKIYVTNDRKISQKRCEIEMKNIQERRKKYSKNGKKGSETRWENKQNQGDKNSQAICDDIASTNTNNQHSINTNTVRDARQGISGVAVVPNDQNRAGREHSVFHIDHYLSDEARALACEAAPRWDQQYLMQIYDERIPSGAAEPPDNPDRAYPAWCKNYTKGKPPS